MTENNNNENIKNDNIQTRDIVTEMNRNIYAMEHLEAQDVSDQIEAEELTMAYLPNDDLKENILYPKTYAWGKHKIKLCHIIDHYFSKIFKNFCKK